MLEGKRYSGGRTSKDVMECFANMGFGREPVHRSESAIYGLESQLPITNGKAYSRGTKQSGQ